jgi:hypothetical protein
MADCGVVKWEVLLLKVLVAELRHFGSLVYQMNSELRDFDVELDLLYIGIEIGFGSAIFVDVDDGDSHHNAVRSSFLFVLRVVHVEFNYDVFNFDLDVEEYLFEGFLEEVHGVVFAELFSGQRLINFKKGVLLDFFHPFLEVLVEILVGFELNQNLIGLDLNAFGDDFGEIGELYFEVANTARVHHVRTGDEVFGVDVVDIETDGGKVEATVFKVFKANFVVDELIEELV